MIEDENGFPIEDEKEIVFEIKNFVTDQWTDDKGKIQETYHPVPLHNIWTEVQKYSNDWPKAIGEAIWVSHGGELRQIRNAERFFSWIAMLDSKIRISWKKLSGCCTKAEFYQYVTMNCLRYSGIETLPHYPPIDGVHYELQPTPPGIYQGMMKKLLREFNPATPLDAIYLHALFLTPAWGGDGGLRPAFVLLGEDDDPNGGRGVGKSAITKVLALLYGTCIDFSSTAEREKITERLLSSASKRLIRLDNVKSRVASEALESLVTAEEISGRQMYVGDAVIPNFFTWIITYNLPELSDDMSERVIPIRLKRPKRSASWWSNIRSFVKVNRLKILADCVRILKSPPLVELSYLEDSLRFPEWGDAVLSRCTDKVDIANDIKNRQAAVKSEEPICDQVLDVLEMKLRQYIFPSSREYKDDDLEKYCYRIRKPLFTEWLREGMKHIRPIEIGRVLREKKPKWLIIPRISAAKDTGVLAMKNRAGRWVEMGAKEAKTAFVIENDPFYSRNVNKTVHRSNITIVT